MISILVPTYNRRHELRQALQSIAWQTVIDYEVIVINDGGKDVSDIVRKSGLKTYSYVDNKKNQGLFKTLNIGLKHARGDLIAFLDDDDIFYPNALEDMLSGFKINSIMGVYANCLRIRNGLNGEKEIFPNYNMIAENPYKIIERNCMVSCARMMKKKALLQLRGFDEQFKIIGDHDLNIKFSIEFGFVYVDKVVCEVRMHRKSLSAGHEKEMQKEYEIIKAKYGK